MKLSQSFIKTFREVGKEETARNAQLLIRAGYIHKEMAGVYDFLPLGLITLNYSRRTRQTWLPRAPNDRLAKS